MRMPSHLTSYTQRSASAGMAPMVAFMTGTGKVSGRPVVPGPATVTHGVDATAARLDA